MLGERMIPWVSYITDEQKGDNFSSFLSLSENNQEVPNPLGCLRI